ncbi:diguanylate cyclase domain-containing protein [Sedimentibacter sp.]|uniref:sensor domain-containing diguanylate cyclase n=1 Tax=Sedimentibacter sp. TaxID=1960295 RepID=UPI00289C78FC|nr:diguanylate cyclase [Sedimentibacter sp.]
MDSIADILQEYLNNVIYNPEHAVLDLQKLPEDFKEFGKNLVFFSDCVIETGAFAKAISNGNLGAKLPPPSNEIAAPLKALHASLKHLTWQTQQVAKGDYQQRVDFMGDFSAAFNKMVEQLEHRKQTMMEDISRGREQLEKFRDIANIDILTQLGNRRYGMETMDRWILERRRFIMCFIDIDNLKFVNDKFGHFEGDKYITSVSGRLQGFSSDAVVCRIGGDEFMLLSEKWDIETARDKLEKLRSSLIDQDCAYDRSISYGIIRVESDNSIDTCDLLSAADEKMYEYKREYKLRKKRNAG